MVLGFCDSAALTNGAVSWFEKYCTCTTLLGIKVTTYWYLTVCSHVDINITNECTRWRERERKREGQGLDQ